MHIPFLSELILDIMKYITVPQATIALVFKNGHYHSFLTEGNHFLWGNFNVVLQDMTVAFHPPVSVSILEQDQELMRFLKVVEIADQELGILYEDGRFKRAIPTGKYAFWKGYVDYSVEVMSLKSTTIPEGFNEYLLSRVELAPFVRTFQIASNQVGLQFRNGTFDKELAPGKYSYWSTEEVITVQVVDMRKQTLEINGQEILTKDKAAVRMNFSTIYQVIHPTLAFVENKDMTSQLYTAGQMALREFVGTLTLDELLESKASVTEYVLKALKSKAEQLGVAIKDAGIRDIILPGEVKEIMAKVMIAHKTAQANSITRREETAATRSLLNTAKLMEDNEMLFKLKEMEYVEKIADKINSISLSGGNQIMDQLKDIFSK